MFIDERIIEKFSAQMLAERILKEYTSRHIGMCESCTSVDTDVLRAEVITECSDILVMKWRKHEITPIQYAETRCELGALIDDLFQSTDG